jgi:pSer/pThr/pTyr-binding forkhead associated (FHA) protein
VSELTLTVIKLGFLAVLWLFVLSAISAMRTDIFGVKPRRAKAAKERAPRAAKPARPPVKPRTSKGAPTKVVVVDGPDKDKWVPLNDAPVMIGRGSDCTLSLSDEYVSTRHARVIPYDGQFFVEDLGSTNGTHIGSERLTRSTPIAPKTQIRIGRTVLELRK